MPTTPFMKMFTQSPFKLLQKHMNVALQSVQELPSFVEATTEKNWDVASKIQHNIVALEHQGDELKKEIRLHLPKSLFLPVTRGDILSMISGQDKIPNQAKDIAGLMLGRRMLLPKELQEGFHTLLIESIKACEQAQKIVNELDDLLESGFRGNEIQVVEKMIDELDIIERHTDDLQSQLRHRLFAIENNLSSVDVIFLYKLIEAVGRLADLAHAIGGTLQVLLAR